MILCNPHNKISKILFKNCKMKMEKWDKNGKSINDKVDSGKPVCDNKYEKK